YELVKYHNIAGSIVAGTNSPSAASGGNLSVVSSSAPGSSTTTPKATQGSSSCNSVIAPDASKETQSIEHAVNGKPPQKQDIAIVGMAGRYPKARNLGELWENLAQGRDCIRDIPADRYERRLQHGSSERYRGGFIDDVDKFDSLFF